MSPDALEVLARKQLGLESSAKVPVDYIDELKRHVMLYEHDTNFTVTLQPSVGYGFVTCLENGCKNERINLVARFRTGDGGLRVGLGSLASYRVHIADHPTHQKERLKRVKAELGIKREDTPTLLLSSPHTPKSASSSASMDRKPSILSAGRRASILTALDSPTSSPSKPSTPTPTPLVRQALARSASMSAGASASLAAVKPEPREAVLPKKRTSDVALTSNTAARGRVVSYKKPKLEEDIPPPVVQQRPPPVQQTQTGAAYSQAVASLAKQEDTSEIREKLKIVQSQISRATELRAKLNRKAAKTKSDKTRLAKYDREIRELEHRKEQYNAALPSVKPLSRSNSFPKVPVASGSNMQLQTAAHVHLAAAYNQPMPAAVPVASGSAVKVEDTKNFVSANDVKMLYGPSDDEDETYDEQGNWHGRGYDHFRGPVAKADDIEQFLMNAGNAENFDGNATLDQALQKLGLDSLVRPLPGMEIPLMPHQAIGVAWMLNKEAGPNKGGILADEMGLGKTVQMISVIATNRSDNPLYKTTLIIAPVALLDQWQLEIDMKTNLDLKSIIYHGSNKVKKVEDLRKYDIVLTTFQTLALEWPDPELEEKERKKKKKAGKKGKKDDNWIVDESDDDGGSSRLQRRKKKSPGLLLQMEFYRVVIDEAQNIRNKRTRVSRAVTQLSAKYRWCLTGTPIINSLSDAYGYIRFLGIRPWYDWTEFNSHIAIKEKKRPDLASVRLQTIFSTILLRRKKDSMLDGKPLVTLPPKTVNLRKLDFSTEERAIYQMVELKSQNIFNRFLRAGTVLKNYHQVLVMLLRLRQICSHPSLIQEDGVAFVGPDEAADGPHDKHSELTRAAQEVSAEFVERMKAKLKETVLERMAAEKESADATIEGEECPICYDTYTDPVVTACTHVFCKECITNVLNGAPRQDANEPNQYKADERPCPTCRGPISHKKLFARQAFEPTNAELAVATGANIKDEDDDVIMIDDMADVKGKGKARPAPGRALRVRKPTRRVVDSEDEEEDDGSDDSMSDFIVDDDEDVDGDETWDARREARRASRRQSKGKGKASLKRVILSDDEEEDEEEKEVIFGAKPRVPVDIPKEKIALLPRFLPSTKMKYMMNSLLEWAESHPDEKTLVISQWTQCLSLVSDYLTEHGFVHVKYQGDMSRNQRDVAVRVFMAKDRAMVMLMSLKCGGVGLNLTRANRVISLDLGWSEAIESQAFDRVHRLGQQREVVVERLVIKDTVEDRVLALQERKKNLADGSLGEGNGKKVGRLSVKELANLFGLNHHGGLL
ncbi:SNF2 family N-terminal domain-containing protein [Cristinia sonorae]|uniref:SNF2 family N-terminal domain-containing protein n=1 Tax=Cristinia sonorae TaxID=1940300 RepID=A0A8K0UKT6_9AGAR|nr:SNF2 family N-terminal domain-containing protein [Cristinia sonorae]